MPSINDWAAKAADRIVDEVSENVQWRNRRLVSPSKDRIAAIIATLAEPLMRLLRDSYRMHRHDPSYNQYVCCPRCACNSWVGSEQVMTDDDEYPPNIDEPCDCGADEWNERVRKVLNG